MRRFLALPLIVLALAPGTWLREKIPPPDRRQELEMQPLPLPPRAELSRHLGPFALEGAWRLTSPHSRFGGYSALLALGGGEMLALGDRGYLLRFAAPGTPPREVEVAPIPSRREYGYDVEAATFDPASKRTWIAWESGNRISRHSPDLRSSQMVQPRAMRDWGFNSGPEAMARLADGRLVVLREGFSGRFEDERHRALVFAGDPVAGKEPLGFTFVGPARFSPTDMAQLPDGRVLILLRRLVWPVPARFAGRIAIADPREIRPGGIWRARVVARLSSTLPVDNFEALAIEPRANGKAGGGKVTVWLMSDANGAVTQRTLLWKLAVDPADLPGPSKKARGKPARASAK